jgi:hypothetical protein
MVGSSFHLHRADISRRSYLRFEIVDTSRDSAAEWKRGEWLQARLESYDHYSTNDRKNVVLHVICSVKVLQLSIFTGHSSMTTIRNDPDSVA